MKNGVVNIVDYDMTKEEERRLFVTTLHPNEENYVYLPYVSKKGKWIETDAVKVKDVDYTKYMYRINNCYININEYQTEGKRANDTVSYINGIYIDLDIHEKEAMTLEALIQRINEMVYEDKISTPTMFVMTGRGAGLYFLYKSAIPATDAKEVERHNLTYQAMFMKLQLEFGNELKVDTCVRNLGRVCRIPGTFNVKAQKYAKLLQVNYLNDEPLKYSLDDFIKENELDELIQSVNNNFKKPKGKSAIIHNSIMKKLKVSLPIKTVRYYERIKIEKLYPVMRKRKQWLEELVRLRNYEMNGMRHNFLFSYYSTVKTFLYMEEIKAGCITEGGNIISTPTYDTSEAVQMLININRLFKDPIPDDELLSIVNWLDNSTVGVYPISDKNLVTMLEITEEEMDILEIQKKQREHLKAVERRLEKEKVKEQMRSLFYAGYTITEISKMVPYSEASVSRLLRAESSKRNKDRRAEIEESLRKGVSHELIIKQYKTTYRYLGKLIKQMKLVDVEETKEDIPTDFISKEAEDIYIIHKQQISQVLENEQENVIKELGTGQNILLTGNAGTGKTTVINAFLSTLSKEERRATLCVAPTAKAALNLNAKTIHSMFNMPLNVCKNIEIDRYPKFMSGITRVIIDEINMVRIDLFTRLIRTIFKVEHDENRHIQIIGVGDFKQTAPVAPFDELEELDKEYNNPLTYYCFSSDVWQDINFKKIILTKVYRQENRELVKNLDRLGYGDKNAIAYFNEAMKNYADPDAIYLCPKKSQVDLYNKCALVKFNSKPKMVYNASISAEVRPDEMLVDAKLELAVGMKVMSVINAKDYVNGSIGVITKLNEKSIRVLFEGAEQDVLVSLYEFKTDSGYSYTQLPIVFAYAISIHKSEGLTFNSVNILPGCFGDGQLYVALSRCKSIDSMHLLGTLTSNDLYINEKALKYTI